MNLPTIGLVTQFGIVLSFCYDFIPPEDALLDYLVKTCNLHSVYRPRRNGSTPLCINVDMIAWKFRGIDEQQQMVSAIVGIQLAWTHPCIRWDPNSTLSPGANLDEIRIRATDTWYPTVTFATAFDDQNELESIIKDSKIDFTSEGICKLYIWAKLNSYCEMK